MSTQDGTSLAIARWPDPRDPIGNLRHRAFCGGVAPFAEAHPNLVQALGTWRGHHDNALSPASALLPSTVNFQADLAAMTRRGSEPLTAGGRDVCSRCHDAARGVDRPSSLADRRRAKNARS